MGLNQALTQPQGRHLPVQPKLRVGFSGIPNSQGAYGSTTPRFLQMPQAFRRALTKAHGYELYVTIATNHSAIMTVSRAAAGGAGGGAAAPRPPAPRSPALLHPLPNLLSLPTKTEGGETKSSHLL